MTLRFQGQNGKNTVFVDPSQPERKTVVSQEVNKKPVGRSRVRNVSSRVSVTHPYGVEDCDSCKPTITLDGGYVVLHGTTTDEKKLIWEALKFNVDTLIESEYLLEGVHPSPNLTTLKSAEEFRVTP